MADGMVLTLGFQRNEGYLRTWTVTDDAGVALDITSWDLELHVHTSAGTDETPALVVLLQDTFSVDASSIRITDAPNGKFEVYIKQADMNGLPGRHQDIGSLVFNLIATDTTLVPRAVARGPFIVEPGV